MERDFLGLSSKASLPLVKEEMNNDNGYKDSGFANGAVVKWPFMNKVSVHPHLMAFNAPQDGKAKIMVSDSITSAGFLAVPSLDVFDSNKKCIAGEPQKFVNHDGQGGIHFSLTPYPVQHEVNSVKRPHDVKMFSVPNRAVSVSMGHPSLKNHFATAGQNMNAAGVKQPLLGGRMTETCVKPSISAPQLTIFYAGTVNVFHDVSHEKAQAIMLFARDGLSAASNVVHTQPNNVQALNLKLAAGDGMPVNQHIPSCSSLASPLSVSSHTGGQGSGSSSNDEFLAVKTSAAPNASVNKVETPNVVNATTMLTSAVPQARKASLARFLEKRKERVMNAAPYNLNKKSENAPQQSTMDSNFTASAGVDALSIKQG